MNIDAFKEMAGKASPRKGAWAKPHANKLFTTKLAAIHAWKASGEEGLFPAAFWQELPSSSQQDSWQQVQLHTQVPSTSQQELQADPQAFVLDDQLQGIEEVWVDHVFYSQPSISDHFGDGRELEQTIRELEQRNPLYPPFPLLQVAKLDCGRSYIPKDHRRLYCFKQLQERSGRKMKTRVKVIATSLASRSKLEERWLATQRVPSLRLLLYIDL